MRTPIGIDLGTTNSLVAMFDGNKPQIITNRKGERSTPSVVGLDPAGRVLIGSAAKKQLAIHPERTIAEMKRLMGGAAKVSLGDRGYSPQELSAMVLRSLKEDAEAFLKHNVTEAVVTVPAYFTDAQRQATKDAGELAGLRVERILNEPTAAALAYGIEDLSKEELVVVYDLGGGTFDVSVLDMFEGVIDVKASAGNNTLGGGDFDRALAAWLRQRFEAEHGLNLAGDRRALARLLKAAEKAKCELSGAAVTMVQLDALVLHGGEVRSLEVEVTRAVFDGLIGDLVRSTLTPIESALRDAGLPRERVAEVVLIGGSSRVPLVRQLVADYFKKEPRTGVNPDEAVALGAAIQAGLKAGAISAQTGIMITDVAPFTLGVQVQSSVGSHAVSGVFSPIIPRNATIPISRTETYATTTDGQEAVTISVFQGESRFTKHNVYLDEYTITGVPKAPAGREKISVTFTYDVNGILSVTTKIDSTAKQATLVVEKSARRMSPIERTEARSRIEADLKPGAPAAQVDEVALRQLGGAARGRASALSGPTRSRIEALLAEAERALAAGDHLACARLDLELTDILFSLE